MKKSSVRERFSFPGLCGLSRAIGTPLSNRTLANLAFAGALSLVLAGCGGGSTGGIEESDSGISPPPPSGAQCETSDAGSDSDQCGTLLVGITDADGDFLQYEVSVVSLSLQRADGTQVEALPSANTVDFSNYVEMTELATAATVPVGTYVRADITLDYAGANILVEVAGAAEPATVVDENGEPVGVITLALTMDKRNQLVIAPGFPAMLTADFDLAASHIVDLSGDAPVAELHPVLVAEVDPAENKEFRLRGPLLEVDDGDGEYRIAVRPFQRKEGRFGGVNIRTDEETTWEIDGEAFVGATGLALLAEQDAGVATVAMGVFDREQRRFSADKVLVGESVPGATLDAIQGHVVARSDHLITVRGARLVRADGEVAFNESVTVAVADTTLVRKPRFPEEVLDTSAISVGQRVRVLGEWDSEAAQMNAESGRVHLLLTRMSATGTSHEAGSLEVSALAFGGRDIELFDFAGTGMDPANDANPAAYEISTGLLSLDNLSAGAPLQARGYVSPFGSAPADFSAHTLLDFTDARAHLLLKWREAVGAEVFSSLDATGLQLAAEAELGKAHHIRRGALRTDLLDLDGMPRIEPADSLFFGRGIYAIAQRGQEEGDMMFYSDFGSFVTELDDRLRGGAQIKLMHGKGRFDDGDNRFAAVGLSVVLQAEAEVEAAD